ncbi:MAG: 5'/3'-nucleotidase SurE [Candidatus Nezhaarchaeota archaeon]|nr:5'/3'-nucleotidase SurE [Candidatus Nezhaarchaeota archaeon]
MILLTNDDGPRSIGLRVARRALSRLDEVFVVVPMREQSCVGKAVTVSRAVRVEEGVMDGGASLTMVDGTPADAVLIALNKLLKQKPRLVVSGINLGPNLGLEDLLDSGTLGAAFEAALRGIPSIAVSYCVERGGEGVVEEEVEEAGEVLRRAAEFVTERGLPRGLSLLSINVPRGFKLGSSPIAITKLSTKPRRDIHVEEGGGYAVKSWGLDVYPEDEEGTDVEAVRRGALSITPISLRVPCLRRVAEPLARALMRKGK